VPTLHLDGDFAVKLIRNIMVVASVSVFQACSERPVSVSASELAGTYALKPNVREDVLELKTDGTYLRRTIGEGGKMSSSGKWHVQRGDGETWVVLDNFTVPLAGGPITFMPHLGRLNDRVVMWVDKDTHLYYERIAP
jgi:hypothetical protein